MIKCHTCRLEMSTLVRVTSHPHPRDWFWCQRCGCIREEFFNMAGDQVRELTPTLARVALIRHDHKDLEALRLEVKEIREKETRPVDFGEA